MEDAISAAGAPRARKPRALILALVVAMLVAGGSALYASWLAQERRGLQRQLAAEQRRSLELREQLTQAEVAVQEKEAALASRDAALAAATQPELPVQVSFRPAWMGQGMVASFHNVGSEQLTLMVEFRDPKLHTGRDFALIVEPGATAEVGHPQGWLVNSGQSVRVAASGYRSVTAFAP